MIGSLRGSLVLIENGFAVIDCGGVGYKVFTTPETLGLGGTIGKTVQVWTYTAVRENAIDLYGFSDRDTLTFFELLLSVSGIGPKSALAILSVASVKTLRSAIASGDPDHFKKTTGIGAKKAEKIILELRDKLHVGDDEFGAHQETQDFIDALEALGYTRRDAEAALKKIPPNLPNTETKIKEALKYLGR